MWNEMTYNEFKALYIMTYNEFKALYIKYLKGSIDLQEFKDQLPIGADINQPGFQAAINNVMTEVIEDKGW